MLLLSNHLLSILVVYQIITRLLSWIRGLVQISVFMKRVADLSIRPPLSKRFLKYSFTKETTWKLYKIYKVCIQVSIRINSCLKSMVQCMANYGSSSKFNSCTSGKILALLIIEFNSTHRCLFKMNKIVKDGFFDAQFLKSFQKWTR